MSAPWNPADLEAEIAEFATLEAGWYRGHSAEEGRPISDAARETMRMTLRHLCAHNLPKPHLFPCPDGGMQCEWSDLFGEVKACHSGTVEAWADLDPEALPSRDETMWEAKGPALTVAAIVSAFAVVARMIPPAKSTHGALVREIKQHPTVARGIDDGDEVGCF